ncbi:hypothetical protein [Planctobacterium marinum]|uniref:hypothetical protein n=1 Tax=Planctobacterium marinum TaxID=1631968 RepID=UPI001E34A704|nr:hypothetical protein [Planctobacterium marinum]MCC2605987.1 hypothetical protein [Planctobacterium marinum]
MHCLKSIITVITLFVTGTCYATHLEGVWELESGEYRDHKGKLVAYSELNLKAIKIINQQHFSFVTLSGETFWGSGTGTFEDTGTQYIETPIFTSYQAPKGQQYVFDYELEGDYWRTSRWEDAVRVEYEVWRKKQ